MSRNAEFWDAYRRPEWQRKRLEVMGRAGFACEECGSEDRTLNVHHKYYTKGAKPWEYPGNALVCLCEDCHKQRHDLGGQLKGIVGFLPEEALQLLVGYAKGLALNYIPDNAQAYSVGSYYESCGMLMSWNMDPHSVICTSIAMPITVGLVSVQDMAAIHSAYIRQEAIERMRLREGTAGGDT